eukprot:m.31156 g.31156  ORF g.31156 m.31156 type:complete len:584 (-) comp14698_c0_seq1:97-1848(-)
MPPTKTKTSGEGGQLSKRPRVLQEAEPIKNPSSLLLQTNPAILTQAAVSQNDKDKENAPSRRKPRRVSFAKHLTSPEKQSSAEPQHQPGSPLQNKNESNPISAPPEPKPVEILPPALSQSLTPGSKQGHVFQRNRSNSSSISSSSSCSSSGSLSSSLSSRTPSPPLELSGIIPHDLLVLSSAPQYAREQLPAVVDALNRLSNPATLEAEFNDLSRVGSGHTCTVATLPQNRVKNRYDDVLPYDHARVMAGKNSDDPIKGYINASFVHGYTQPNAYIATQAPLPNTIPLFWQMVWENDVRAIIMLGLEEEKGHVKMDRYWPEVKMKSNKITIKTAFSFNYAGFTERRLVLKYGRETRELYHFHVSQWNDREVSCANDMLKFWHHLHTQLGKRRTKTGPLLVHCSAGVGRTGTFIGLDRLLTRLEKSEADLDVKALVQNLRMSRANMVQTPAQYLFLFHVLHQGLLIKLGEAAQFYDSKVQPANKAQRWSWLSGRMTRARAENLLTGTKDSQFLVRESAHMPGRFAVAICTKGEIHHMHIHQVKGMYTLDKDSDQQFPTLESFVQHMIRKYGWIPYEGTDMRGNE